MRRKLWCPKRLELIYLDKKANSHFWDAQWDQLRQQTFASPPKARGIIRATRRWLKPPARILEGGCGMAQFVHALDKAGYQVTGVDFAPRIVDSVKMHWPHLDVRFGDVRQLPLKENEVDGYWSFGVIEHWPDGYLPIAREMLRVIRPNGFLFLTFPMFSPFRIRCAQAGLYPSTSLEAKELADFYQFGLKPVEVIRQFEELGFCLRSHGGLNTWQGLGEDIPAIQWFDEWLNRAPRLKAALGVLMDATIGKFAGHSCILVFQNQKLK